MKVSALWVYPVKSFRGVRVERARALPEGFAGDRRWMVVQRKADGTLAFVTQRTVAGLVRVRASLEQDGIVLRGPSGDALVLPDAPPPERELVTVWESTLPAIVWREADEWLARETGLADVHLAKLPTDVTRSVTSSKGRAGDVVSFADAFPYLITNAASLDDLDARLEAPVTMERFRPNVVVSGARAWEEDGWSTLRAGEVVFAARKPCGRCVVTTIDPDTGDKGNEPLKTLATFREKEGKVNFGVNFVALSEGEVRVGDEVYIS
ncbi:MAG TPA: MOSC N-terminal beta barrel domain-containing protein [Polyangiaceae bacterium]|nr:MOSC N-terminal beta barrel domain-containing protein [Polyangiaceae bacterium]